MLQWCFLRAKKVNGTMLPADVNSKKLAERNNEKRNNRSTVLVFITESPSG